MVYTFAAKVLGTLAVPNACPRCFWLLPRLSDKPYFNMPRIFSDIDRYTKKLVHQWFGDKEESPTWLKPLGEFTGYLDAPNHRRFRMAATSQVIIRGEADEILVKKGGALAILDYKTAHFKGVDDPFFQQYRAQLNAYCLIAEHLQLGQVETLALVYTEAETGQQHAGQQENRTAGGFKMDFTARLLEVDIDRDLVPDLAKEAVKIYGAKTAPKAHSTCEDCALLDELIGRLHGGDDPYTAIGASPQG